MNDSAASAACGRPDVPSLGEIEHGIWTALLRAAVSRRHPWHLASFATVDAQGAPQMRSIVLRDVQAETHTLSFYTDRRSPKVRDLLERPTVGWLFWNPQQHLQLRCVATARLASAERSLAAFEKTSMLHRRDYSYPLPPGSGVDGHTPPPEPITEIARENFLVVDTVVQSFDWLRLSRDGHVRVEIAYRDDGRVDAGWRVP